MSGNTDDSSTMDRRVRRTRRALIEAYNGLVLSKQSGAIKVADIIAAADVGRSTFYEHYSGRDALHLEALSAPLGIVADALTGARDTASLSGMLEHFWDNRAKARETFSGPQRVQIARLLADLIETRLTAQADDFSVPPRLIAVQLAEAQLGVIRAWILGEMAGQPGPMADAITASSAAMIASLSASTD